MLTFMTADLYIWFPLVANAQLCKTLNFGLMYFELANIEAIWLSRINVVKGK